MGWQKRLKTGVVPFGFLLLLFCFQNCSEKLPDRNDNFAFPAIKTLTISSNVNNLNLFVEAGSPTTAKSVVFNIQAGVVVGSTSVSTPALVTGNFPSGSTVTIVNGGTIVGHGGNGGVQGAAGGAGGPALSLSLPVSIANAGYIYGGGGGGGGGYLRPDGYGNVVLAGGGGGGGCGDGAAGAASTGSLGASSAGTAGTNSAGGNGGAGAVYNSAYGPIPAGNGGAGGACGAAGAAGQTSTWAGGAGGAAGPAIIANGNAIMWMSGQAAPHVAGAIN